MVWTVSKVHLQMRKPLSLVSMVEHHLYCLPLPPGFGGWCEVVLSRQLL